MDVSPTEGVLMDWDIETVVPARFVDAVMGEDLPRAPGNTVTLSYDRRLANGIEVTFTINGEEEVATRIHRNLVIEGVGGASVRPYASVWPLPRENLIGIQIQECRFHALVDLDSLEELAYQILWLVPDYEHPLLEEDLDAELKNLA
jgi:hypothetical protein